MAVLIVFRKAVPLRKPMSSSSEQRLVAGDLGQYPVEGFVFHRDATQQSEDGLLVGHRSPHACDTTEVAVEPLYPVGGVYHALYLRCVVEVNHVRLVVGVVAHVLDGAVVLAPPVAQVLPPFPSTSLVPSSVTARAT